MAIDARVLSGVRKARDNYEVFAREFLKYLPAIGGELKPFVFNAAQRIVHAAVEQQRRETGMVRAIILKGRKQGISTWVSGRFYHATSLNYGTSAMVLAHLSSSANGELWPIVKRFHENNPLAPRTSKDNTDELEFSLLDSRYTVATAGSKGVGRGGVRQKLHASEFAFWLDANEQFGGAIKNLVKDVEGSEIILESTANGRQGNLFCDMWEQASIGDSPYIPIFIPWFIEPDYKSVPRESLILSDSDLAYQEAYRLSIEQMAWRANQIAGYGKGFEWIFDREFPATPALAFSVATGNPLISPVSVSAAVNSGYRSRSGPIVIGCDPAGDSPGADRTAIVWRQGRVVLRVETYQGHDEMQIAGILAGYYLRGDDKGRRPDAIFIDKGGLGSGIVSRLKELNVPVHGVHFAGRAHEDELYGNMRAEMWWRMKAWIEDLPCTLPADQAFIADICSLQAGKPDSSGRRMLEKKEDAAKRGIRSPDLADALALTFADFVGLRLDSTQSTNSKDKYAGKPVATSAGY